MKIQIPPSSFLFFVSKFVFVFIVVLVINNHNPNGSAKLHYNHPKCARVT